MDSQTYLKDGADRVLEILKETFGDRYTYVNGLLDEIPESLCPLIMASTSDGEVTSGATGTDDIDEKLIIAVVINRKDYIGASDNINIADLTLRRLIMGQHPTTSQYLPQTIMYAIRTNFTLDNGYVDNRVTFDFTPVQRGDDYFTQEATLTMNIRRMAMVPTRI